ncbi:FliH/SctL family protein [Candidatus Phycosocius spiralis]|uniref:Protein FlbE n=1 Tax=Candidatus Phycosocius spiralis TaxID=2815099 RepID=A0ABQ4PT99_9PROT|nr:FliH/SctL family protein [Candidatus Phycosocius spiralis]GIU66227.1 protein FlbE [Candidatus Phycosocius spiralis]
MILHNKYSFEPMFTKAGDKPKVKANQRKLITDEDIAEAHASGFEQGRQDELVKLEASIADILTNIAQAIHHVQGQLAEEIHSLRQDAAEVAITAARSVAGSALDAYGHERAVEVVAEAVSQLRDVPRIIVRVPPQLAQSIEERLISCAREAGFSGELAVRPDPEALMGDCALDWGDGLIVHDRMAAFAAIEAASQKWIASAHAEGIIDQIARPEEA